MEGEEDGSLVGVGDQEAELHVELEEFRAAVAVEAVAVEAVAVEAVAVEAVAVEAVAAVADNRTSGEC